VRRLRSELVLDALGGDWEALEEALAQAHELASVASAPALAWHADWAEAVRAVTGGPLGAPALAQAATGALDHYGEHYAAARLMAELLARMGADAPAPVIERTAAALTEMGAHASAALLDAQAVSR
jgi:hypothetical protein